MLELSMLAAIIQGEAGVLGWEGMFWVARTVAAELEAGWTTQEILDKWHGRQEPGVHAVEMAGMVLSRSLVGGPYLHCLSLEDTKAMKVRPGDFCVSKEVKGHLYELHFYKEWPG